jgi:hypothetical protein
MTREQIIICPVPTCRKRVKRLEVHFRNSHPDIDPGQFGVVLGISNAPRPAGVTPDSGAAVGMATNDTDQSGIGQGPKDLGELEDEGLGAEGLDGPADSMVDDPETRLPPTSTRKPEAATEPPPAIDLVTILAPITDVIKQQQDVIGQQQAAMAEMRGQLLQQQSDIAEFKKSVVEGFNSLPTVVDRSLTSRLDQLSAKYKQQQASGLSGADPTGAVSGQMAQDPKASLMENLLPILLQKFMGGGEQQNGMGQIIGQLQGLGQLMNTIGEMQRTPWMQGAKFVTDVFATGARIGLTPDQTAASMTKTLGDMGGIPSKA